MKPLLSLVFLMVGCPADDVGTILVGSAIGCGDLRGDGVSGVGGVADVERRAALHGVDGADLPAAEDGVGEAVAVAKELATVSNGQIVDEAGDVGDGEVVVGLSVVGV